MISLDDIYRIISPLIRKVSGIVSQGVIAAVNNPGTNQSYASRGDQYQRMQLKVLGGETLTDVPRMQEYGFETYPEADGEVLALFIDGERENGVITKAANKASRPTDLVEKEVAVYTSNDVDYKHRVHLKADGSVEIYSGDDSHIKLLKDGDVTVTSKGKTVVESTDNFEVTVAVGKKIQIGDGTNEVLALFDDLLTELQKPVDNPGTASTGSLTLILAALAAIQAKLGNIKA